MASPGRAFEPEPAEPDLSLGELPADDPPPLLGTWPRVYRAVIVYLALVIAALYWLTEAFAPKAGG